MGKMLKIGIVIMVIGALLLFFVYGSNEGGKMIEREEEELRKIIEREEEELRKMSDRKLMSLSVDWNYKDMLRNIDDYSEELIFVEGVVKNTQKDYDVLTLYVNCDTEPEVICYNSERIFVDVNGLTTWLEDDQLSGFVKVTELAKVGKFSDTTGEFISSGDYIPRADEIKLTCSNC